MVKRYFVTLLLVGYVCVVGFLLGFCVSAIVSPPTTYIECGMCGAHVSEWWYVRSDSTGEPIEVCEHCYEQF